MQGKQCKYFSRNIRKMKRAEDGIWEMSQRLIVARRRANGETATLLATKKSVCLLSSR